FLIPLCFELSRFILFILLGCGYLYWWGSVTVMDKMTQKLQFADQLKVAMQAKGYAPKASILEREFNLRYFGKPITLHAAGKWLRGEAIPHNDKVVKLAKWLEVQPANLVYGLDLRDEIDRLS
ncbi:hypothetical protein QGZ99_01370, partial [Kingella kingae]|nr:hypothetical protein [Kingella kingae]MDK4540253.1 hypothetical protein [Kingella kingae]MDK4552774.1 hypothetical protein [Kingella kingae]